MTHTDLAGHDCPPRTAKTSTRMTPETRNVEWKRSWRDDCLAWICGFANARGGVLEIGKDDDGDIVGVRNVLSLLEDIPSKVRSLLGIVVEVNLKSESGLEYIEIVVEPHPNPISYRGKFHYRGGSAKQVLEGAALTRFLLEKHGRTWDDAALPGVKLSELDGRVFDGFRRMGVRSERLPPEAMDESDEDVIERLRLRDGAFLKRAAALLFHPSPHRFLAGSHVEIGHYRGPEPIYRDVIEGDLFTQVDRTLDLLYTKYTRGLISYDGIYRVETFPVPRAAMREAVVNAVIHRDYARRTSTHIRVYHDRITIRNPAELPVDWSVSTTGGTPSEPQNPRVAHAFLRAGLIEAWGRGIHQIRERSLEAGNPTPLWTREPGGVLRLRFPFSEDYLAADAAARGVRGDDSRRVAGKGVIAGQAPEYHRRASDRPKTRSLEGEVRHLPTREYLRTAEFLDRADALAATTSGTRQTDSAILIREGRDR